MESFTLTSFGESAFASKLNYSSKADASTVGVVSPLDFDENPDISKDSWNMLENTVVMPVFPIFAEITNIVQ